MMTMIPKMKDNWVSCGLIGRRDHTSLMTRLVATATVAAILVTTMAMVSEVLVITTDWEVMCWATTWPMATADEDMTMGTVGLTAANTTLTDKEASAPSVALAATILVTIRQMEREGGVTRTATAAETLEKVLAMVSERWGIGMVLEATMPVLTALMASEALVITMETEAEISVIPLGMAMEGLATIVALAVIMVLPIQETERAADQAIVATAAIMSAMGRAMDGPEKETTMEREAIIWAEIQAMVTEANTQLCGRHFDSIWPL